MKNLSTYGAKALFYININDDPPFKFQETLAEGSELPDPFYSNTFKIPGEYTITGRVSDLLTYNMLKCLFAASQHCCILLSKIQSSL